jgi:hypothetical protein
LQEPVQEKSEVKVTESFTKAEITSDSKDNLFSSSVPLISQPPLPPPFPFGVPPPPPVMSTFIRLY